jgi:hypothetical protein
MNRRDSRHGFETRLLPRSLLATCRGLTFYVTEPLSFTHELTLVMEEATSWYVTVRSGSMCNERRAT